MTNRLTAENYRYEAAYTVRAKADDHLEGDYTSGMLAYYDFDNLPIVNRLNESEKATLARMTNGVNPNLAEDGLMSGQVVHVQGGTQDDKKAGYLRMPNPLLDHPDLKGATISLWVIVSNWNAYFNCLLYITDPKKFVLQVVLRRIILTDSKEMTAASEAVANTTDTDIVTLRAASIMLATVPILCVYPFLQKYFVKGVLIGSLKG